MVNHFPKKIGQHDHFCKRESDIINDGRDGSKWEIAQFIRGELKVLVRVYHSYHTLNYSHYPKEIGTLINDIINDETKAENWNNVGSNLVVFDTINMCSGCH